MMYQEKMVCTIKSNGKVLREQNGSVFLPFNSIFTIFLKNLNSRRAKVNITIDDEDILNGSSLVIDANSDLELKRFLTNDDEKGPQFKFVEKTDEIRKHRGENDGMDGIVKVTFQYEARNSIWFDTYKNPIQPPYWGCEEVYFGSSRTGDSVEHIVRTGDTIGAVNNYNAIDGSAGLNQVTYCSSQPEFKNDDGMTVKGEEIKQEFTSVSSFICDYETHTICLQLKGDVNQNAVKQAVTVKTPKYCEKCNKSNKWNANFCSRCGNSLKKY